MNTISAKFSIPVRKSERPMFNVWRTVLETVDTSSPPSAITESVPLKNCLAMLNAYRDFWGMPKVGNI